MSTFRTRFKVKNFTLAELWSLEAATTIGSLRNRLCSYMRVYGLPEGKDDVRRAAFTILLLQEPEGPAEAEPGAATAADPPAAIALGDEIRPFVPELRAVAPNGIATFRVVLSEEKLREAAAAVTSSKAAGALLDMALALDGPADVIGSLAARWPTAATIEGRDDSPMPASLCCHKLCSGLPAVCCPAVSASGRAGAAADGPFTRPCAQLQFAWRTG